MTRISEHYKYDVPEHYSVDEFLQINGLTENDTAALDWFAKYVCEGERWYAISPVRLGKYLTSPETIICEALSTISPTLLKKSLNRELGADNRTAVDFISPVSYSCPLRVYKLRVPSALYNPDEISKLCNRMMWVFTCVQVENNGVIDKPRYNPFSKDRPVPSAENYIISVEPQYSTNVTSYVKNDCAGKVYHMLGSFIKFNSILKTGLRMKGSERDYRQLKNKVYFTCGATEEELKRNIKEVAESLELWDVNKNRLKINAFIVEADVCSYNVNFYVDTAYENVTGICFSYAYFPPRLLRDATSDIKKLFTQDATTA